jgi:hypothetical protein
MKDLIKNPIFLYAVAPVIVAFWPLLIVFVYLPNAQANLKDDELNYNKAQEQITEILKLDPTRLALADAKLDSKEFDYTNAVSKVVDVCQIASTKYKLSSGILISSGGKKSQSAKLVVKEVDIVKIAKFLSVIQKRWSNLQCTKIKLNQKKGLKDKWDADIDFEYFY